MNRFYTLTILFIALLTPSVPAEITRVTLLHTNDIHSQFTHQRQLQETIHALREQYPDSLLFDAGDFFESKVPKALMSGGEAVVEMMNGLGYDGATLGDNAFDGFELNEMKQCLTRFNFPVLISNLVDAGNGDPIALPYWIYTVNQTRIGVIGIYNEESLAHAGLIIANPQKVVQHYAAQLRNHVDCLVLLSHQGIRNDHRMAQEIGEIDVIIGGSSQKALQEPIKINDTIIAQAGAYAQYVGVLELEINTELNCLHAFKGYLKDTGTQPEENVSDESSASEQQKES